MVRQPRWNQYEAALLLDYCVMVEEKKSQKLMQLKQYRNC